MAGIYGTILENLVTQLQNDSTLSDYVKAVYKGVRDNLPPTILPCIIIEPNGCPENWSAYGRQSASVRRALFRAEVHCLINTSNVESQLIGGDDGSKGVMDFAEDVMNAVDSDLTLGGSCSTCSCFIPEGGFIYDNYPQREIIIIVEAEKRFRQGGR